MAKFVIQGGNRLKGEINVSGSKNAVLKLIAATILSNKECILKNIPDIADIKTMLLILEGLGASVEQKNGAVKINSKNINKFHPKDSLVNLMRASVLTIGPLLARFGKAEISQPGGCIIGVRSINTHLDAFRQLGVEIIDKNGCYSFKIKKKKGSKVILKELSVTATENILLYAAGISEKTEIRVAAAEPEIEDLCNFLNKMGAKVTGGGTHFIKIYGTKNFHPVSHNVIPDRIEAGTLAIAAAITNGNVTIKNVRPDHLDLFLRKLQDANVNFQIGSDYLHFEKQNYFKPLYIDTRPYPGFSTDMQSPIAVLLTQAKGQSHIFETLFEGRFNYVKELVKMGADCKLKDNHNLFIKGPKKLKGKTIYCSDLRAGAALLLATLMAKGESTIENIELIERGYENIDARLNQIGANIKRVL